MLSHLFWFRSSRIVTVRSIVDLSHMFSPTFLNVTLHHVRRVNVYRT
jgi:hypothetical protein